MNRLIPLLILLSALAASAADRITLTLTVTNPPVTSNTLTINGSARTWTNASASTTILTNLTGVGPSATNLYNQIAAFPYSGGLLLRWSATNAIQLVGSLGGALSASISGTWATLSLSTQSGPSTFTALWPLENMVGPTNRTNQGSALAYGISTYSTQALAAGSTTVSNLVNLYSNQTVAGNKTFTGTNSLADGGWNRPALTNATAISGLLTRLTNGYSTNLVLDSPTTTNLVNRGAAISSPGTNGSNSQQFGAGARATNANSLAVGSSALALGSASTAIGSGASALQAGDQGFGSGAYADAGSAIAIGVAAEVYGINSIGIGRDVSVNHSNSIAIGYGSFSTTSNEFTLGSSLHTVTVPGVFAPAGTLTNLTVRGTNVINGRVDFTSRANTGLANGNNAGVVLGTNVYVRLSGATTIGVINGFAAEQDGSFHIVQFSGAVTNTIANESGVDPTAANRIVTGTGADVSFTNNPTVLGFIYDATSSRWRMATWTR